MPQVDKRSFINLSVLAEDYQGNNIYTNRNFLELEEDETDEVYRVKDPEVNRLDKIAYRKYGDEKYMWWIADINNIPNPLILLAGTLLTLPELSRMEDNFDKRKYIL